PGFYLPDDHGACGQRHGDRAGLDAHHRADRRHHRVCGQPGPVFGHAAPARRHHHGAASDHGLQPDWHLRRLHGGGCDRERRPRAILLHAALVHRPHRRVPGPVQGHGVRAHTDASWLFSGLFREWGRQGRRYRDHTRGRNFFSVDPMFGLLSGRHLARGAFQMTLESDEIEITTGEYDPERRLGAEDPTQRHERWQVRVVRLHKSFDDHQVLRGVDLDIERGRINMIIGGSGQGKSVLMKHLMGLLKPDSGHIYVDGIDVVPMNEYELNEIRKKFGLVFQYAALFDSMSVEENVIFPLVEHTKLGRQEMLELAYDMLGKLNVPEHGRKFPAQLSGGQRKRVALARAL